MARPKLEIDEEQVFELAKIQCTLEEIANVIGTTRQTISSRFLHIIEKGREEGKKSLRRAMYDKATKDGNVVMQIWLSKQYLGMSDKVENKQEVKTFFSKEDTKAALEQLRNELKSDSRDETAASTPITLDVQQETDTQSITN